MSQLPLRFPQKLNDLLIRRVAAAPVRGRHVVRSCRICRTLRIAGAIVCRAAMRMLAGLSVAGRENLPTRGSFILVANHTSHLDAPALLAALPLSRVNRAFPAAASDYFFTRLTGATIATIFLNALPVDRGARGRRNARRTLDGCRELLKDDTDNVLIVFPEGTRSPDGTIGSFRRGIGEVVAGTNIPIIPCRIEGAIDVWPKRFRLPVPFRGRVRVTIGKPLTFGDRERGKASTTAIAAELRQRILSLAR